MFFTFVLMYFNTLVLFVSSVVLPSPTLSDVSRAFLYLYQWKVRGVGLDAES